MLIAFDTETTGLSPKTDEILTLSIVDGMGNVLFDGRFRPKRVAAWPQAQKVNGISPEDVAGLPSIDAYIPALGAIFGKADEIVAYNLAFDLRFIKAAGIAYNEDALATDAMWSYSAAIAEPDPKRPGQYKRHKLVDAVERIGYKWEGRPHTSVADAQAALAVEKWARAAIEAEPNATNRMRAERWRKAFSKAWEKLSEYEDEAYERVKREGCPSLGWRYRFLNQREISIAVAAEARGRIVSEAREVCVALELRDAFSELGIDPNETDPEDLRRIADEREPSIRKAYEEFVEEKLRDWRYR